MRIAKVIMAVALGISVGAAFFAWFPFPFVLAWPGIAMARFGMPHSWVVGVIVVIGVLLTTTYWARANAWWAVIAAGLLIPSGYCAAAFLYATRAPIPLFDAARYPFDAEKQAVYLECYDTGYREAMYGRMWTYCFYPEVETRGFEDGAKEGGLVFYRFLGRQPPVAWRETAAETDGSTR